MDLQQLFSKLEYAEKDSLILLSDKDWKDKVVFPSRVIRLLEDTEKWSPKAIFHFDNKPLILFFENPNNKADLHKAIWNFNETPIVFIIEDNELSIYNGFAIDKNTQLLKRLGGNEVLNDFSYFELVTGKTLEQYKSHFKYKHRVDYYLLKNIEATQEKLLKQYQCERKVANSLIGKVIFIRYLIDRKIKLSFDGEARVWGKEEFSELLLNKEQVFEFFTHLQSKDKGFNGDLFPISKTDFYNIPDEAFILIKKLLKGGDIKARQPSLFQLYDFSVLPIELISNVYERFIGKENQTKAGAYYTPTFLVDYIISQTVTKKLNSESSTASCKVLDPACGSGIFLVETLRKIIEKYIEETNADIKSEKFKSDIKELVKENIFGVDKDLSAIQVAIFSIYLTLLDYLEPPAVESFKFPILLNSNFFEADFFDANATYNATFKDVEFDFILGNPPWKGGGMSEVGKSYLRNRRYNETSLKKKFNIAINNNEIVEGFVFRVSDFCHKQTQVAFIIRSSSLYNLGYNNESSPFRQYLLEEYFIDKVFELSNVRHEVFDQSNKPAIAPPTIIFYRYANGENTDGNILDHISLKQSRFFSLFKVFSLNRSDYKEVQQNKLKEYDWLWKVLVYGSYLDFNLIRRIKENYNIIKRVIENEKKFIYSTGFHSKSKALDKPKDTSKIENLSLIKTEAIESFHIDYDNVDSFENDKVDIIKDTRIYQYPALLIREGIDRKSLTARAAISTKDILFKDSITSIKILNKEHINVLYNIQAIYSSCLFLYYAVNTFASIGIERSRVKNYNKFSLPYLELDVQNEIEQIEKIKIELYKIKQNDILNDTELENLKQKIDENLLNINNKVLKKLDLSDCDNALIDYAIHVNKTMIVGDENERKKLFKPIKKEEQLLKDYAQLFLNRFQSNLSNKDRRFIVEIWHTNQIIGMFFKVIPVSEYTEDIKFENKQSDFDIIKFITRFGSEKITEQLFIQKDVRGFEEDYFYIFKPNEKRLWHKAIGYLDVNEFADAILKAGREGK